MTMTRRQWIPLLVCAASSILALPAAGAGLGFALPDSIRAAMNLGIRPGARIVRDGSPNRGPGGIALESFVPATPRVEALGDADGAWTQASPPEFFAGIAAYDSTRDRMLLCAGSSRDGLAWQLAFSHPSTWTSLPHEPGSDPPTVYYALGVMDTRRDRLVVFGGDGSYFRSALAYTVDLEPELRWNLVHPSGQGGFPPGRSQCAGIYDSKRDRLIVFGGFGERDVLGDVWALSLGDTAEWREIHPAGEAPSPRMEAQAVYDPEGDRLIVYGGLVLAGEHLLDQTDEMWQLTLGDSIAWTRLNPGGDLPGPLSGHRALWDTASSTMLVIGGGSQKSTNNDVFQYDPGINTWTRLAASGGPKRAYYHPQVAYDRVRDRYLLYGTGASAPDDIDVDEFRLRPAPAWNPLPGRVLPQGRFGQATIHDTRRDRMVIFGGVSQSGYLADPWFAPMSDPFQWSPLETKGTPPSPRHEPVGVYDPLRDRAVFFGGWVYPSNYFNDVWVLSLADPPTWTQMTPIGSSPLGRRAHAAVYDPARDRMLVYGGSGDSQVFGDLWALHLEGGMIWEPLLTTGTPPPPRYFPSLVYDPSRDRVLVYGGGDDAHSKDDVWELRLADLHWSRVEISPYSPALERHMASFDTERDRMLVHGGWSVDYDVISIGSATFALVFRPEPHWEVVRSDGTWPSPRAAHSQLFDPLRDRLDIFGGTAFFDYGNDRWMLQFTTPEARHAWAITSSTFPGRAHLEWQYVEWPGASILVERMEAGGDWRTLGTGEVDGRSRIVFDDAGLRAGWRYSYRLRILSPQGVELAGIITVDIPGATTIDLLGARPNPARASEVAIWFSLPVAGNARLTMYDLRGRVVWDESLIGVAAGPRVARPDTRLSAGIYFIQVEQSGRRALQKVTVLP
jgi:hypothetical protein